jgi:hypothetical protein
MVRPLAYELGVLVCLAAPEAPTQNQGTVFVAQKIMFCSELTAIAIELLYLLKEQLRFSLIR